MTRLMRQQLVPQVSAQGRHQTGDPRPIKSEETHYVTTSKPIKDRNVIERCYCRLKDFRRIATRYDKLARNYFSALCLVAAVAFWL